MKLKLLPLFFLVLAAVTACSESPKTYSCELVEGLKYPNSLSVNKNSASFNTNSYKTLCKKAGNVSIYGLEQVDCDSFKESGEYTILAFDDVILSVKIFYKSKENPNFTSSYQCTAMGK